MDICESDIAIHFETIDELFSSRDSSMICATSSACWEVTNARLIKATGYLK